MIWLQAFAISGLLAAAFSYGRNYGQAEMRQVYKDRLNKLFDQMEARRTIAELKNGQR